MSTSKCGHRVTELRSTHMVSCAWHGGRVNAANHWLTSLMLLYVYGGGGPGGVAKCPAAAVIVSLS